MPITVRQRRARRKKTAGEEDAEETAQAEDTTEAEAPRTISGVVCWGDDLINGEGIQHLFLHGSTSETSDRQRI